MLKMLHAAGRGYGRENSVEALSRALKHHPDLIEVDVRKSRDGVLFCYHGFPAFPFFLLAYFLRWFSFATIKKIISVNTLEELIAVPDTPATFFLDMKHAVDPQMINVVCSKFPQHTFWIASRNFNWLSYCKKHLPPQYTCILNRAFLVFKRGVKRAHENAIYACKLFPFQCATQNIEYMKDLRVHHMIENKKLAKKFGSLWVCVDAIPISFCP